MRLALCLVATAACAEPAVEMKLVMPASSTTAFDMSCVTAVDLLPVPTDDVKSLDIGVREYNTMEKVPCVDLPHAPSSFDDFQSMMHGQFDLPLPDKLAGVEFRARTSTCSEVPAYREAVFYGGGMYQAGQDRLTIPLAHNISCDKGTSYIVRPVDMIDLVKTKQCAAPATATTGSVGNGAIRPTMLDPVSPIVFETGISYHTLTNGTTSIQSYSNTWAGTCPAMGWYDANGISVTCINPTAPAACAKQGEVELPMADGSYLVGSLDPMLTDAYSAPVFVVVYTTTGTAGPISGATITVDSGIDAKVIYGEIGATKFTATAGGAATGPTGAAMIYANKVTGITVSAPGKTSQHVWVGSDLDSFGTALVVLN